MPATPASYCDSLCRLTVVAVAVDLVADDAADSCAAKSSDCATARENGPAYSAYPGARGRVPVLSRHIGTATQSEQYYCEYCDFDSFRIHDVIFKTSSIKSWVLRKSHSATYRFAPIGGILQ